LYNKIQKQEETLFFNLLQWS